MELVRPAQEHLAGYLAALHRGWSPNTRSTGTDLALIELVQADPQRYLQLCDDRQAQGPPIVAPDGSTVPRLPGIVRWLWDGQFAGSINLRWQPGTTELPPTCLGHIGYAVVPWKRRRGYATAGLRQMLPLAAAEGLPQVEVVTDVDNLASQRVVLANGGVLLERFELPAWHGGGQALRWRIDVVGGTGRPDPPPPA